MANILIVDDDAAFRDGLAETLADLGHRAVEAATGHAALSTLRDGGGVECIFLDFRLPDLDGLAVLAQLRDDPALAAIPVVMLTAHATSDNTIEAMRLGAFDHLTKPIGRRDIAQLLERVVSANQPPALATAPPDGGFAGEPSADRPRLLGVSAAMRDTQSISLRCLTKAGGAISGPCVTSARLLCDMRCLQIIRRGWGMRGEPARWGMRLERRVRRRVGRDARAERVSMPRCEREKVMSL